MYPAFDAVAKIQEEKGAIKSFQYAYEAEKIHEEMYKHAKGIVSEGKDLPTDDIYICPVCGLAKDKYHKF